MTRSETVSRQIDVLAIGLFGLAVGALTIGMARVGQISPDIKNASRSGSSGGWNPRFLSRDGSLSQAYTGKSIVPLGSPMLHHPARRNTQVKLTVVPEVN